MSTRGLKKVIAKIYLNAAEKDSTKRTFRPDDYPKNLPNAVKYVNAKGKRLQFNTIFRSLYAEIYADDLKAYLAGGHKLTTVLKKGIKENAKAKAKEITKAQLAAKASAQQGYKEQEDVLPEAD